MTIDFSFLNLFLQEGTSAANNAFSIPQKFSEWLGALLIKGGIPEEVLNWVKLLVLVVCLLILCAIGWWIARVILLNIVDKLAAKTASKWDDYLVERKVFRGIAYIIPALILHATIPVVFHDFIFIEPIIRTIADAFIVGVVILVIGRVMDAVNDILLEQPALKDKPIASYIQLAKIVVWVIGGVMLFSVIFHKSPLYFFSGLGAISAVLLLVFKDAILGFVASIQIAALDLVRVGDWVSKPQFGADGNVTAINLTTVMIRNWDKTISTVPTYAFISESFKNWRGMEESAGRRIKRSIPFKVSSIKFCDEALIEKLKGLSRLKPFLESTSQEIEEWNKSHGVDTSNAANGRNLTNIGVFRKYAELCLFENQNLNHDLTTMVRQLEPTEKGLPLEIYCFSANKNWVPYEGIQSDIFDHLLAIIPEFELEVFEDWNGE